MVRSNAARASSRRPGHALASATVRRRWPEVWAQVVERGYEGLVARDPLSSHRGGRLLAWLKVKVPNHREAERGWEPEA